MSAATLAGFMLVGWAAGAATLPSHGPLDVLVVSDGVNPHGLASADLTEPGEIAAAIQMPGSGLNLGTVAEVDSQCVDDALTWLQGGSPPDVLIYFAHRAAQSCAAADQQPALTAAVASLLQGGGGVVVFHHGLYVDGSAKDAMLSLLGGSASSIAWDTTTGQRVIDVAPGHFVTTNGVAYTTTAPFDQLGVPSSTYDAFVNLPDERYPATSALTTAGEDRTLLFATDSGGARILGYDLSKAGWLGRVVAYQPGEYQPNSLDDLAGNNFQILANAIVYVAGQHEGLTDGGNPEAGGSGGAPNGGAAATGGAASGGTATGGALGGGGDGAAGATGGGTSATGGQPANGGSGPSGSAGAEASGNAGAEASGSAGAPGGGSANGGTGTGGDGNDAGPTDASGEEPGCSCRQAPRRHSGATWAALVGLLLAARRKRRAEP